MQQHARVYQHRDGCVLAHEPADVRVCLRVRSNIRDCCLCIGVCAQRPGVDVALFDCVTIVCCLSPCDEQQNPESSPPRQNKSPSAAPPRIEGRYSSACANSTSPFQTSSFHQMQGCSWRRRRHGCGIWNVLHSPRSSAPQNFATVHVAFFPVGHAAQRVNYNIFNIILRHKQQISHYNNTRFLSRCPDFYCHADKNNPNAVR